jgi:hypothetical protein
MTHATADPLIDVNPGRTFRFGFNNSYQARVIVQELDTILSVLPEEPREVQAIIVEVSDNPFSVDLAASFERELRDKMQAKILSDPAAQTADSHWLLRTAGRGSDGATPAEVDLARRIVERLAAHPNASSVVVLPTDLDTLRHLAAAIKQERFRRGVEDPSQPNLGEIYLLAGDSIDYYDVTQDLQPNAMPGPLLFFSHVNPVDQSIAPAIDSHRPAIGLNRDLALTLFSALRTVTDAPTPDRLTEALRRHSVEEGSVLFESFERAAGGGAVVATPAPMGDRFEVRLPKSWVQSP